MAYGVRKPREAVSLQETSTGKSNRSKTQKLGRLKTIIPLPKEPLVKTGFPASVLMLLMLGIIAFLPPY